MPSLQGVIDLMRDVAAAPDLESLTAQCNS